MKINSLLLYIFLLGNLQLVVTQPSVHLNRMLIESRLSGKNSVSPMLKDLEAYPLKDKQLTIILEDGAEINPRMDEMLKTFIHPIHLLRVPQETPHEQGDTANQTYISISHIPLTKDILLIMSDNYMWWPLRTPPIEWKLTSILLVSLSNSCGKKNDFLSAPLLQRTPSVSFICSYFPKITPPQEEARPIYKVWTWLPFAEKFQQLVYIGSWSGESSGSENISSFRSWNTNPSGSWNLYPSGFLNHSPFRSWKHLFPDRFQDMSTKKMMIDGSNEDRPLLQKEGDGSPFGINFLILKALSQWLNYTLVMDLEGHNDWAVLMENVANGKRDMMINYATLTPQRNKKFQLSVPYHYEGFGLMLKIPPPLPRWRNVVFPFTREVWAGVAIAFVIASVIFYLLNRKEESSIVSNVIVVIKSLVSSPLPRIPSLWSTRWFLLGWWLASWVLDMSYTCNLIAVLTVPAFPAKIQSTKELADSDNRLCMLDYGEFVPGALQKSSHKTFSALGRKLDLVPLRLELENVGEEGCVELVLAGTHAHTETYSYLKILYSKLGHNLYVYPLKEQLYPGYLSFLIQKGAPWKYKFDVGMQRLTETGLIRKWYEDIMNEFKGNVGEADQTELRSLTLAHLQGPFLVWACCLFLVSLVMAVELISDII